MAKHPRKKQKTSQKKEYADPVSNKAARLEMLMDEESKDDEERRLESLLFGVKYVPKEKGKGKMQSTTDDEDDEDITDHEEGGARGMQHLLDQDLFFVDDGAADTSTLDSKHSNGHSGSDTSDSESGSESDSGSQSSSSSTSFKKSVWSPKGLPKSLTSSKSKRPAWVDPADTEASARVSLLSGPTRLRKLRQAVDEDEITGRDYETRLRSQFEQINPEPAWARKARGKKSKGDGDDEGVDGLDQDGEGIGALLSSTTGILAESRKKGCKNVVLPHGTLAIERVRDANHSVQGSGSGEVRVLAFHPKPAVPVLCVATADRRIRLFNVDGHLSPLLTTLHTPSIPIVSNSSVLFHPQGNSLLISGPRPFFYTYDLQQGTSTLHRRGLWGAGFDDSSILSPVTANQSKRRRRGGESTGAGGKGGGGNTEAVLHTAFSPSTGSLLAVAGRGGNVHIVDWKSGAGQVITSLKCSSSGGGGGGGVQGLCWVPSSAGDGALGNESSSVNDERHLAVLTGEAEVYIWDVAQRRCVRRWKDEGGYRGAGRVFSAGGGLNGSMAIGSSSGFVNVYGADSFSVPHHSSVDGTFSSSGTENPKLAKALGHLTTPISTLRFNHDAQILAMASKDKKDSMRLVHVPTLTAFGSWPTSSTPLGHVTAVDFSARSEYVAIGNTRGRVLLYHLKDYGSGSFGVNGF